MYTNSRDFSNISHNETEAELLAVAAKSAAIAAGVVIAVELYRHRKLLAVAGAFTAALMWTNRAVKDLPHSNRRKYRKISGTPSFAGDDLRPASQMPVDDVEEALMESFPASDPPASHRRG